MATAPGVAYAPDANKCLLSILRCRGFRCVWTIALRCRPKQIGCTYSSRLNAPLLDGTFRKKSLNWRLLALALGQCGRAPNGVLLAL